MKRPRIAILGSVGVPGAYGGFETLAENLVRYHAARGSEEVLSVYCSTHAYPDRPARFLSADLRYIPLKANGLQSILYDICSLFDAVLRCTDVILLLGVSGALALPLVRLVSKARIVTNLDGIEWKREKWKGLAKIILRWSERAAVRWSHAVVADNGAIAEYVRQTYGTECHFIPYGGDHAVEVDANPLDGYRLPKEYAFSLGRIEPENNVHIIVEAFARKNRHALVMVGNWNDSLYGRKIRKHYAEYKNIFLLDPIYDLGKLKILRSLAHYHIHGHSAGGTNPSLVEAMHFGRPVLAFDCDFNRHTTENKALFFKNTEALVCLLETTDEATAAEVGYKMRKIARKRYTWDLIAGKYFDLLIQ